MVGFSLRWLVLVVCTSCIHCMQRVALVTGANRGIGKEIARNIGLLSDHVVVLGCRDEALGMAAMEELRAEGCNCVFSRLDLTDYDSICSTREFVETEFGRLDALVNSAAICFNDPTLYGKLERTPFDQRATMTINTNYFGTLDVTDAMLPLLRESDWSPRIVNLVSTNPGRQCGSVDVQDEINSPNLEVQILNELMTEFVGAAQAGKHAPRWPNIFGNTYICYDVSQMGLDYLTRVLARDEPTIMVNSVDPGSCATEYNNFDGEKSAAEGAVLASELAYSELDASGEHYW